MRPSSSSDPNAPYRAAIASLVDCNFFKDEQAEQPDVAHASYEHSPFVGLSPRGASSSNDPSAIADAGPSSASQVSVGTIRQYLLEMGHSNTSRLKDNVVKNRLNLSNLSAETLLRAIQYAYDINRPLPENFTVSRNDRAELIYRLAGIITNKSGFLQGTKDAAQNSNNNPEKLITNLLQHIRNQNP